GHGVVHGRKVAAAYRTGERTSRNSAILRVHFVEGPDFTATAGSIPMRSWNSVGRCCLCGLKSCCQRGSRYAKSEGEGGRISLQGRNSTRHTCGPRSVC